MVTFTLNGKEVKAEEGSTILQVAEENNIYIPTLCNHKALEPAGLCRLCSVELFDGRRTRFVTACNYPAWTGMEVKTDTEEVHRHRKVIVELLLARCPNNDFVKELAGRFGVEKPRFRLDDDDCILCGLCVRMCERIGARAIDFSGRGTQMEVATPFGTFSEACVTCGACDFICPTGHIKLSEITDKEVRPILSEYDEGLKGRKPVYVPYAQAVPNIPAIDRAKCAHFLTGDCKVCADFCPTGAIDHTQVDEEVELEVGAIILATGFRPFDPSFHDEYSYAKHPNVVTSMEFERILSSSGPWGGHLVRPSDEKEPERIAWLQCVGSRDINHCDNGYCSGVCCMYAIKEAVIAKEHSKKGLDAAIFFMDIRTPGKEFEQYYNRAQSNGVRFLRSRVHSVDPVPESDNLRLTYVNEASEIVSEEFDMVVLSVGLEVPRETEELAEKVGVDLNHYRFATTSSFNPVETSRPGVYACGVLQGPKDIPISVMEASAAAGAAASRLADSRHALIKEKTFPEERDVSAEEPRIGVFVCNCGVNISSVVRVPEVVEYAKTLPNVVFVEDNLFSCSTDAQAQLVDVIKQRNLNRVVIAACSPRTHEPLFQETLRNSSLNKYLFEQANIRDQCSWVHSNEPDAATDKAKDLVRMSVARASLIEPLPMPAVSVNPAALVIGGGAAGMTGALTLAEQGFEVHIVEKSDRLGGQALNLKKTWKGERVPPFLKQLVDKVKTHEKIEVHLNSQVKEVSGFVGNFKTVVGLNGEEDIREIEHGVTILATGAHPSKPDEYLYGDNDRVFCWHELDEAWESDLVKNASSAAFIQCVGSREPERPHCSKICCTFSVQKAVELKERNPEMDVYVLYRDIRTYGEREDIYKEARAKGVIFIRFDLDRKPEVRETDEGTLELTVVDHVLQRPITLKPDFITLASAIETRGLEQLAQLFKVPLSQDNFFMEVHMKLRPVDFATDGVFVCGLAHYPKPIDESISQAQAAAARAATVLAQKKIEVEGVVSSVDQELCRGCGQCVEACPYGAPELVEISEGVQVSQIQEALCKGCGACAVACPTGAAAIRHFTDDEVLTMIDAALCE
ncbi:MAG: FAD-dependent oxidoreductase [Deltaproteobacteria bacterium]|nr:MAG: FAD-dependent oxidoreductase [Deltaproteobacteria bacterium]